MVTITTACTAVQPCVSVFFLRTMLDFSYQFFFTILIGFVVDRQPGEFLVVDGEQYAVVG